MAISKAKQIINLGSGQRAPRAQDTTHNRGTRSFASFQFTGVDYALATALNGLGALDADAAGGSDFAIITGVNTIFTSDVHGVGQGGAVKIDNISILTNEALTIAGDTIQIAALRKQAEYANPISTGATVTIDSIVYDVEVVSGLIATDAAITRLIANAKIDDAGLFLQGGDKLVLFTSGLVTEDISNVITINICYTKMVPGGRLTGEGDLVKN